MARLNSSEPCRSLTQPRLSGRRSRSFGGGGGVQGLRMYSEEGLEEGRRECGKRWIDGKGWKGENETAIDG